MPPASPSLQQLLGAPRVFSPSPGSPLPGRVPPCMVLSFMEPKPSGEVAQGLLLHQRTRGVPGDEEEAAAYRPQRALHGVTDPNPSLQPRETDGNSGHETQSHGNRYSHKASALVKEHSPSKQDSLTPAGIKARGEHTAASGSGAQRSSSPSPDSIAFDSTACSSSPCVLGKGQNLTVVTAARQTQQLAGTLLHQHLSKSTPLGVSRHRDNRIPHEQQRGSDFMLLLPEFRVLLPPCLPPTTCPQQTDARLFLVLLRARTEYEPERSQQKKTNTVLPAKSAGKNGLYLYGETTSPDFGRAALTSPSTPQMARGSSIGSHKPLALSCQQMQHVEGQQLFLQPACPQCEHDVYSGSAPFASEGRAHGCSQPVAEGTCSARRAPGTAASPESFVPPALQDDTCTWALAAAQHAPGGQNPPLAASPLKTSHLMYLQPATP
ncbi:hypothetical protein Anapl_06642 [Anas platyrhynchos]|uniref:Uncharacterized protein n=1 Tax=Anas platyrhynchos TaxID=8839 RepID=R0L688_ANAPL|nr:hypothetical protein Anapl_06642 [Anas platyrhynchos]